MIRVKFSHYHRPYLCNPTSKQYCAKQNVIAALSYNRKLSGVSIRQFTHMSPHADTWDMNIIVGAYIWVVIQFMYKYNKLNFIIKIEKLHLSHSIRPWSVDRKGRYKCNFWCNQLLNVLHSMAVNDKFYNLSKNIKITIFIK